MATASATIHQAAKPEALLESINQHLGPDLLWALLATAGVAFAYRFIQSCHRNSRLVSSLNNDTQRYFSIPSRWWSVFKGHILHAPLLRGTHSIWRILGQIPTRAQALFLISILSANLIFCFYNVPYKDPDAEVLGILRARTGTIAVANFVPVVLISSVRNPLIRLLDISHDTFNLMHRWFARIAILETAIHISCQVGSVVKTGGWSSFSKSTVETIIWTGLVAGSLLIAILVQSISIIRRAVYEAFLHLHVVLAILVLVFLWMHLSGFPQRRLLLAAIVLWGAFRILRLTTLVFRSLGRKSCTAVIELLPRDAVRITVTPPRPWTYKPGQYIYLTIPSIGLWTAHPFSIAWSSTTGPDPSRQSSLSSQVPTNRDVEKGIGVKTIELGQACGGRPTFSLLVRARDGFTKELLSHSIRHAPAHLGHRVPVNVLVEGPYGLSRSLDSYGTVLLISGGVGVSHHLGYVRHLLQGYADGIVATRKIAFVWAVRHEIEREIVGTWINEILNMEGRREVLVLEVYVTRGSVYPSHSPSHSVFVRRGRPNLHEIVKREAERRIGCLGVSVCGPGGLQDDARKAVRREIGNGRNIDLTEVAFGW